MFIVTGLVPLLSLQATSDSLREALHVKYEYGAGRRRGEDNQTSLLQMDSFEHCVEILMAR